MHLDIDLIGYYQGQSKVYIQFSSSYDTENKCFYKCPCLKGGCDEGVNLKHIASLPMTLRFLSVFVLRPYISLFCPLQSHNTTLSDLICVELNLHFSNRHPNIAT